MLLFSALFLLFSSFILSAAGVSIRGSDLSYLNVIDCDGNCSPFRSESGGPVEDALALSKAAGVSHVRVRIWVNPSASTPNGWPGPDYQYANLTNVLILAKRIVAAKMELWLDFHYSDVWADPGHQFKPAAWVDYSPLELVEAVSTHTTATLIALAGQGTPPSIIQIGNEITNGMLWQNTTSQNCSDGGRLYIEPCEWHPLAALVAAGLSAARAASPSSLLLIHTDLGNQLNVQWDIAAWITEWYGNLSAAGAADWDGLGLSFYPKWGAGNTTNLRKLGRVAAALPAGRKILIAETAYPYMGGPPPAGSEFPYTPQGQLDYALAISAELDGLGEPSTFLGWAWWGGEYYSAATGAGHTALFNESGVILPVLAEGGFSG